MFCQKCGQDNNNYSLYCLNDGVKLQNTDVNFTLRHGESKYCTECGSELDYIDNFCQNCGESTYGIFDKKIKIQDETEIENEDKGNSIKKLNKESILAMVKLSSVGFGVILVISTIFSLILKGKFKKFLALEGGLEYFERGKDIFSIPNLISLVHGFNMKVNVKAGFGGISGGGDVLKVSMGFAFLLLLPILIFLIIGFINNREDERLDLESMIITSIIYGILVALSSIFIKKQASNILGLFGDYLPIGGIDSDVFDLGIKIKISKLILILRASILSFIGLNIGTVIKELIIKRKKNIKVIADEKANSVISIFLVGILFTILITFLSRNTNGNYNNLMEYDKEVLGSGLYFLLKLGTFIGALINTFLLINGGGFIQEPNFKGLKLSVIDLNEDIMYYSIWDSEKKVYLYLGMLFIIFLFFLYGRRYKKNQGQDIKGLLLVPLFYTVFLGSLAYLTSISGNTIANMLQNDYQEIFIGFTSLGTFIGVFIVAILGSFVGYLLTPGNNLKEGEYE